MYNVQCTCNYRKHLLVTNMLHVLQCTCTLYHQSTISAYTYMLCLCTGALRNISSAGIDARRFLRGASGLVDTLVWIVRAATGQDNVDEKVCNIC